MGIEPYDGSSVGIVVESFHEINGLHSKLKMLEAASKARALSDDTQASLKRLSEKIKGVSGKRNKVAHGIWEIIDGEDDLIVLVQHPLDLDGRQAWTVRDFEDVLERILELNAQLRQFLTHEMEPELRALIPRLGYGVSVFTKPS